MKFLTLLALTCCMLFQFVSVSVSATVVPACNANCEENCGKLVKCTNSKMEQCYRECSEKCSDRCSVKAVCSVKFSKQFTKNFGFKNC